jgi:O-acetyl-ADP-ribose deacetylase (regulator of RNase III)
MIIDIKNTDIFDIAADCFLASGNVQLNMSGGVNGALLGKYGQDLQDELKKYLADNSLVQVQPGFIYKFRKHIPPYKMVIYSAGVNVWYNSTIELVADILEKAIEAACCENLKSIVTVAIGTNYGNLSRCSFGKSLKRFLKADKIDRLTVCERNRLYFEEICRGFNS